MMFVFGLSIHIKCFVYQNNSNIRRILEYLFSSFCRFIKCLHCVKNLSLFVSVDRVSVMKMFFIRYQDLKISHKHTNITNDGFVLGRYMRKLARMIIIDLSPHCGKNPRLEYYFQWFGAIEMNHHRPLSSNCMCIFINKLILVYYGLCKHLCIRHKPMFIHEWIWVLNGWNPKNAHCCCRGNILV